MYSLSTGSWLHVGMWPQGIFAWHGIGRFASLSFMLMSVESYLCLLVCRTKFMVDCRCVCLPPTGGSSARVPRPCLRRSGCVSMYLSVCMFVCISICVVMFVGFFSCASCKCLPQTGCSSVCDRAHPAHQLVAQESQAPWSICQSSLIVSQMFGFACDVVHALRSYVRDVPHPFRA